MGISTLEDGKKTNQTELVRILPLTVLNMRENGSTIKRMGSELNPGQKEHSTRGSILKGEKKDLENSYGLMDRSMRGNF